MSYGEQDRLRHVVGSKLFMFSGIRWNVKFQISPAEALIKERARLVRSVTLFESCVVGKLEGMEKTELRFSEREEETQRKVLCLYIVNRSRKDS